MKQENIEVLNAHEHNLKNINVKIPHNSICGICGVSGSGKSTLAKDVIAQYGFRNFSYSLPSFMRGRFYKNNNIKVDEIKKLPPIYLIDIKNSNKSIRSTVATMSNILVYLRDLFCLENKIASPKLFSYNIPEVNGGGACPHCNGTGTGDTIVLEAIIGDNSKSIFNGGFKCVNKNGIKNTKINELFLKAFFKRYQIDETQPVSKYTEKELSLLLYGTTEPINFIDRSGANGGKKSMAFTGIINALLDVYERTKNKNIQPYITHGKCQFCNGVRYNDHSLSFTVQNKTISDFLNMSISEFLIFFQKI